MKKVLYTILAISMAAFSCTKELDNNVIEEPQNQEESTGIVSNAIPETITGVISDNKTKTSYDANGDFNWANSDQVRLIVTQNLTTYSKQGIYTYCIKSLSDDKKTATFTSTSSAGDLTAFVDGDWKSTGYAMYPTTILNRFDNNPESHSYGAPWFTLAQGGAATGNMSDIILIGVNDSNISNFKFYTAMSVLKVTLKNIPANAAAIKLCSSDKTNYPIDGDFAISTDSDGKPAISFLSTYVSSFKGYQKVDVSSQSEIAEASYYFNIPATTYPANTLSILIEDANGGMILKRTINTALTLSRNDCLAMPAITYSYSVSVTGTASAPGLAWTIDCKRIRFHVSTDPTNDINDYVEGYTFANDNATGSYSSTYAMSSFASNKPSASGQYYLHYLLQSDRGTKPASMTVANVVGYGTIPFYYLSSTDATNLVGTYKFQSLYSLASFDRSVWRELTSSSDNRMVIATSDDVSKGNVMITDMFGLRYDGTVTNKNLTNKDGDSVFELKKSDGALKTWMSTSSFAAGNPVYGYISGDKVYFNNTTDQVFFVYDGTNYVLRNQSSSTPESFSMTYNSSASPVTLTCDSRICIVPPSRYTGSVDGAWSLIWNSSAESNDASNIVGKKQ